MLDLNKIASGCGRKLTHDTDEFSYALAPNDESALDFTPEAKHEAAKGIVIRF